MTLDIRLSVKNQAAITYVFQQEQEHKHSETFRAGTPEEWSRPLPSTYTVHLAVGCNGHESRFDDPLMIEWVKSGIFAKARSVRFVNILPFVEKQGKHLLVVGESTRTGFWINTKRVTKLEISPDIVLRKTQVSLHFDDGTITNPMVKGTPDEIRAFANKVFKKTIVFDSSNRTMIDIARIRRSASKAGK